MTVLHMDVQVILVKVTAMVAQDVCRGGRVQDGLFMGSEDLGADGLAAVQLHLLHQQCSQRSRALQLPSQVILPDRHHWHSLCGTLVPVCVHFQQQFLSAVLRHDATRCSGWPLPPIIAQFAPVA